MEKTLRWASALLFLLTAISCQKNDPGSSTDFSYHNFFGYSVLETYYLWNEEISSDISRWKSADIQTLDPIAKVKEIRYKENGKDYDRWTELTDDFCSFEGSVSGVATTYGFDLVLYWYDSSKTSLVGVVSVVYEGSPAQKAGLKRGDVLVKFNGKELLAKNYASVITENFFNAARTTVTLYDGRTISMTAVEMYENPILCIKTFALADKKVGYLAYNSFTQRSIGDLIDVCTSFKADGIDELILDLRYNTGGFVIAEEALASMLAPQSAVTAKEIFQTEVYNKDLTQVYLKEYGEDGLNTRFSTEFSYTDTDGKKSFSTKDANIGITKIYALVSSQSASASEGLLVGLLPYMDIDIIGETTHGKFCAGILISSEKWSTYLSDPSIAAEFKKATEGWGIYVMVSTFADKNGNNPCMPDGIVPGIKAEDKPLSGYELGDENEPMLKTALQRAGKVYAATSAITSEQSLAGLIISEKQIRKPGSGFLIKP